MGRGRKADGMCGAYVHATAAARRQRIAALAAEGATSSGDRPGSSEPPPRLSELRF